MHDLKWAYISKKYMLFYFSLSAVNYTFYNKIIVMDLYILQTILYGVMQFFYIYSVSSVNWNNSLC